jgi:hypothetical protein
MHRRTLPPLVVAVLASLLASLPGGCDAGSVAGRGPVSLAGSEVQVVGGLTLRITVPSCLGDPELARFEQGEEAITVRVVTTTVDEGPACADLVSVVLDEPLGGRPVVDDVSGEPLRIVGW